MTIQKEYKNRLPPMLDKTWDEDQTQKITQKPDGSIERHMTIDGYEVSQTFHASGAYEERRPDGTTVRFASNNHLEYQKGGFTLSVDNNGDVKIAGHSRLNIDTDAHIEVGKNASIAVNGMAEIIGRGHVKFSAADISLQSTEGNIVLNAARDIEVRADQGRITHHSSGVQTFTTDSGDFHVDTAGMFDITSKLDASIISTDGNGLLKSKNTTTVEGGSKVYAKVSKSGVYVEDGKVRITKVAYVGTDDVDTDSPATVDQPPFHSP